MKVFWRVSSPETVAQDGGGLLITVRIDPYDRKKLASILCLIASAPEMLLLLNDLVAQNRSVENVAATVTFNVLHTARALLREIEGD